MFTRSGLLILHEHSTSMPEKTENATPHVLSRMTDRKIADRFDGVALAIGGVALALLAYTVHTIINPFVAAIVLYIVLTPFRQYRAARKLLIAGFVLFGIWAAVTLEGILVPFILGAVLAYLFNPLVTNLQSKRQIDRVWSSLATVVIFCGIIVAAGWIFLPSLGAQTKAFIERLTAFVHQNANNFDQQHLRRLMLALGLPAGLADRIITEEAMPELHKLVSFVPAMIIHIIGGMPRILERALNLIIVPIAMFYFLKDWPKIIPLINDLFPSKDPVRREKVIADVDRVLYGYVRGQVTVAAIIGILGAIAFSILGIPYAGLLGVMLAVSDLIPVVGMIFSVFVIELVIVLTMVLNFGVIFSGLFVIGMLHLIETYVIGPRIIGQGIGVPPILMILSLLVFGYFFGFAGLLVAVPTTGIILLFINEYRDNNAAARNNISTIVEI